MIGSPTNDFSGRKKTQEARRPLGKSVVVPSLESVVGASSWVHPFKELNSGLSLDTSLPTGQRICRPSGCTFQGPTPLLLGHTLRGTLVIPCPSRPEPAGRTRRCLLPGSIALEVAGMHRYRPKGGKGLLLVGGMENFGVSSHICGPFHDNRARKLAEEMPVLCWGSPFYSCSGPRSVRGGPGRHSPLWVAMSD